ncbi:cytochrome P450 [Pseudonocardia aurantiaca]|uniref:Cytochrome P450 n=1 Tax=Pseudonocardia aurantiaca TaxID=75290 RepID=A0ABW4FLH3_9PSEU
MVDSHQHFFDELNWFDEEHCTRMDDELRWARSECPVVHTNYDGGMHVVTRYDDLRAVAEHPDVFSSSMPGVNQVPVALPPLDLDPPLHRDFRTFLNRPFSRASLSRYQPVIEQLADDLIDGFVEDGRVEFVSRFAIPFTAGSLAKVVLDDDNEDRLRRAIDAVTAVSVDNSPESFGVVAGIAAELMAERESTGAVRDDFLQSLVDATVEDGRPLTQTERLGVVTVLLLGGLDTTRGALAYIGRYLAEEPGMEERLRRPDWTKRDLDELLRFTSTVSVMGRLVTKDNDLLGVPLKAGDRLAVHWRSGNRDESKFDNPDRLDFERSRNPHAAFGIGIHRCLGQHFARLQLEIAVNRLLARLTNFRIASGTAVKEAAGISIGAPEEMHLAFDHVATPAAATVAEGQR